MSLRALLLGCTIALTGFRRHEGWQHIGPTRWITGKNEAAANSGADPRSYLTTVALPHSNAA